MQPIIALECVVPRPRARMLSDGADAMSDEDLLELVLAPGTQQVSAREAARRILSEYGSLEAASQRSARELATLPGLGPAKATRVHAALALARRVRRRSARADALDCPEHVHRYLSHYASETSEVAITVALDLRLRPMRDWVVGRGTAGRCALTPREVFLPALREGAARLLFAHTHPSGDPTPSTDDLSFTQRLVRAGELLGVPLVDHIVIATEGYTSLATLGWVPPVSAEPKPARPASTPRPTRGA